MCGICAELRPWDEGCAYAAPEGGGRGAAWAGLDTLTHEEIGGRLLTRYWGSENPRSFEARAGDTLTVDLGALGSEGRALAKLALEEWSTVTGLRFSEARASFRPSAELTEVGDAAASTGTSARIGLDETFEGRLTSGDRDWVRFELPASGKAKLVVEGLGRDALSAPSLKFFDAAGREQPVGAVHEGSTATTQLVATQGGGTYYAQVWGLGGASGDYRLTMTGLGGGSRADIVFDDGGSGAKAEFTLSGDDIVAADVTVSQSWLDTNGDAVGTYGFHTYLHEIGHALGLGHPGVYGRDARFDAQAEYRNDSWQTSVMSYFSQSENPHVDADKAYAVTPMAGDLEAVRRLYGATAVREGDTTYGENSDAGGVLDLVAGASRALAFTVIDTGGDDVFDLSSQRAAQRLDLREGAVSDVFGHEGNMVIARGTRIEDARLGRGDDYVWGNGAINDLRGGDGDDRLWGEGNRDGLRGGAGDDRLWGGTGGDWLRGESGADRIYGQDGADSLRGGSGRDALRGGADDDVLRGGGGNDRLNGDDGDDTLRGQKDDDRLRGGDGDDRLVGGGGRDRLDGGRGEDRLLGGKDDDRLRGGADDDRLDGGAGRDRLRGDGGRDRIEGGAGDDRLRGGDGADRFVFRDDFGRDVIQDFGRGEDRLDLRRVDGLGGWSDLRDHLRERGDDAVVDLDDAGRIVLRDVDVNALTAGDFVL